jgi:hypothetical protein
VRSTDEAAAEVRAWLNATHAERLNVAGPRASGDPEIGQRAAAVLKLALNSRQAP